MEKKAFIAELLRWYEHQQRDLPWRHTKDPYLIWLSEIILQQTRIKQGLPYYERFVKDFPSVEALAQASEQQVLRLWQGLGYYSRARNLHACAQMVVEHYHGKFPTSAKELLQLKGIGSYTAAAIASFAFNEKIAVVDGNVYRVLSRVFGIHDDISIGKTQKIFQQFANQLIAKTEPALFNQAIMDFGAIQCTPKSPACGICPMHLFCYAFNQGKIEELPLKSKKIKIRNRYFQYFIFQYQNQILMRKRGPKDIWQGLFEFPLMESAEDCKPEVALQQAHLPKNMLVQDCSSVFKHVLTHQHIFARFYRIEVKDLNTFVELQNEWDAEIQYIETVHDLPKPILIQNYLKKNVY